MKVLFAVCFAFGASYAAAQDGPGLSAQKARERIDVLPTKARVELKKMYRRYVDLVARQLDQGWRTRVLSEAVIEDVDEPFSPVRLVAEMIKIRREEIARIKAALSQGDDQIGTARLRRTLETKRTELAALVAKDKREKGLCRDWSDQIWSEFQAMNLENWTTRDERRAALPYHTAAVACAPTEPSGSVCLAFDPWEDGRPNVFAYEAWDKAGPGGRFPAEYFRHDLPETVAKTAKNP